MPKTAAGGCMRVAARRVVVMSIISLCDGEHQRAGARRGAGRAAGGDGPGSRSAPAARVEQAEDGSFHCAEVAGSLPGGQATLPDAASDLQEGEDPDEQPRGKERP